MFFVFINWELSDENQPLIHKWTKEYGFLLLYLWLEKIYRVYHECLKLTQV